MKTTLFLLFFIQFQVFLYSQNDFENYAMPIPNSNKPIIQKSESELIIERLNKVTHKQIQVISIFNQSQESYFIKGFPYNGLKKIKSLNATVYDKTGKKITKLKEKDFKDQSSYADFVLYSDQRIKYLEYYPKSYPITIKYEVEYEYKTTLFLPSWTPIDPGTICMQSNFKVSNQTDAKLKMKFENFEDYNIEINKNESENTSSYSLSNGTIKSDENLGYTYEQLIPTLKLSISPFYFDGKEGSFKNWKSFGKWYYEDLLAENQVLSDQAKAEIDQLIKNIKDPKLIVQELYQYLQKRSRYVYADIEAGGWIPRSAQEVYEKKYGDCKALSNFMISMLKHVGIHANYCIVYGSAIKKDIDESFESLQGNHVIVNVPLETDTLWLECTNTQQAFNVLGPFTDDRYVIAIGQKGTDIVKTPKADSDDNKISYLINTKIDSLGYAISEIDISYYGAQYMSAIALKEAKPKRQKEMVVQMFENILPNQIKSIQIKTNWKEATANVSIATEKHKLAKQIDQIMILEATPYLPVSREYIVDSNRVQPFFIQRPKKILHKITYTFPAVITFQNDSKLPNLTLDKNFGKYTLNCKSTDRQFSKESRLLYEAGEYDAQLWNEYVRWTSAINKSENKNYIFELQ